MKTERDLFEEAIVEKCRFNPRTSFELSDVTGDYKSDVTYFAWIMWQASASREGYAVVNKKKLAKVLNCVTDEWLIDTDAMNEFKEIELLVTDEVEAMTGATP